jgi:kinesin family protein 6/9
LFDRKEQLSKDLDVQIFISYLEIYNENAFDLLNAENIDKQFNKWDKVSFFFDEVILTFI